MIRITGLDRMIDSVGEYSPKRTEPPPHVAKRSSQCGHSVRVWHVVSELCPNTGYRDGRRGPSIPRHGSGPTSKNSINRFKCVLRCAWADVQSLAIPTSTGPENGLGRLGLGAKMTRTVKIATQPPPHIAKGLYTSAIRSDVGTCWDFWARFASGGPSAPGA